MRAGKTLRVAAAAARNMVLGGNLASITLLARPRRMIQYVSESLFLYRALGDRRGLPERSVARVLGNGRPVADVRLARLDGETWMDGVASYTADLLALCMICRLAEPLTVFEIGTLTGYTTHHMALNTRDDAVIYTLDLPKDGEAAPSLPTTMIDDAHVRAARDRRAYCFDGTDAARKIRTLEGDSATFDFSPYHGKVDLFFIDGAHSYEYVRSDTEQALACCRPGGIIAWHDFGRMGVNGVTRRLRELRREGHDICVVPGGSLAFMLRSDDGPRA